MIDTVNITVRVEKETKKQFDSFCDNVGINPTAAVNMFIKAVLRTRQLPFTVTDVDTRELDKEQGKERAVKSIESMRETSVLNGNSEMTLDEINAEIEACRKEA